MGLLDRIRGSDRDRFARRVLERVRAQGVAEAWLDNEQFAIGFHRHRGEARGWVFLDNVFRECAGADRSEQDDRIARLVDAVVNAPAVPEDWPGVKPLLRPVLRSATFGLGAPPEARPLMWRPAPLPCLIELAVVDTPTTMAYVTVDRLDDWGVTAADVFAAAYANLAALDRAGDRSAPDQPALIRFVEDGDGYFVSRLMLPGWLASLQGHGGGTPVAFIPDQSTVIVGWDDPELLQKLFSIAEEEFREAGRPLSPMGYTVDATGAVVPCTGRAARRAQALLAASEYDAESGFLAGSEAFVANLLVAESAQGNVFTVASWARDVDTLLPRADYIAFTSDAEEPWFVPFDVAIRAAGLRPEAGMRMERYRARQWPAPDIMANLRDHAESP